MYKKIILSAFGIFFVVNAMEEQHTKEAKTEVIPVIQEPKKLIEHAASKVIETIFECIPQELGEYLTQQTINEPINKTGQTWLHKAKNAEQVQQALALNANPSVMTKKFETPLNTILANGYSEAALALLDSDKELKVSQADIYNVTPMHNAAYASNEKVIEKLLEKGAKNTINNFDNAEISPLFYAIINNPTVVNYLILQGADIHAKNFNNATSVHFAAQFQPSILPVLFNAGGKNHLNDRDNNGATPLLFAAGFNELESVKILLENGADPNISDNNGRTPLMAAAQYNPKIAQMLIDKQADVNAQAINGFTPLMYAAQRQYHVVKKLLKTGKITTLNAQSNNQYSALRMAINSGNLKTVNFLLKYNAQVTENELDDAKKSQNEDIRNLVINAYNQQISLNEQSRI